MNAIRIRTCVDSETLHLPELRPMVGKEVEIFVIDREGKEDLSFLPELTGRIELNSDAIEKLRQISKT